MRALRGLVVVVAVLAIGPASAAARTGYVANYAAGTVVPFDASSDSAGTPLAVGGAPEGIAITPDGARVYVANANGSVDAITTSSGQVTTIPAGADLQTIAITPDGTKVFAADSLNSDVEVIDTATDTIAKTLPAPSPLDVAISPDGSTAYVTDGLGIDEFSVTSGDPLRTITPPSGVTFDRLAITPDGQRAFVTTAGSVDEVLPVNLSAGSFGAPIPLSTNARDIAINPSGSEAYVTLPSAGSVVPINLTTDTAGAPIAVGSGPNFIAITPDGGRAFVSNINDGTVRPIDLATNTALPAFSPASGPRGIAVVPDQAPTASFTASQQPLQQFVNFDASASSDPDGTVASYHWDFGDGTTTTTSSPTLTHTYTNYGQYTVTLTVTDNEGCSTQTVFTGHTAYCNGSSRAQIRQTIQVGPSQAWVATPANGGSDTSNFVCSSTAPCATLAHAADVVSDEGSISIGPGTYTGSTVLPDKILSIASSGSSTLTSAASNQPVIELDAGQLEIGALTLSGGSVGLLVRGGTVEGGFLTLSHNGDGLFVGQGSVSLADTTVADNTLDGVFETGGAVTLVRSTIADNASDGWIASGGTSKMAADLLARNLRGDCSNGFVTDAGYNRTDDGTCPFSQSTSQGSVSNLELGPLADNGGYLQTMAPASTSGAIDQIPSSFAQCAGVDERYISRPQGAGCDVGAVELVTTATRLVGPAAPTAGQPVTLTATVSATVPLQPWPAPAGPVSFSDGSSPIPGCIGVSPVNGVATCHVSGMTLGTHHLSASYDGLNGYAGSSGSLDLLVGQAPALTSGSRATFLVGQAGTFTVTSTGSPAAALSESGTLPAGVTFVDHGDGTAALSGTPGAGTAGTYKLTITAHNGYGSDASQTFTLTVDQAPAITSGSSATFVVGQAGSFTVTSTGSPTASVAESGSLPAGGSFKDNGDGTATLAGTPGPGTAGTYKLTLTAHNGAGADATQAFTLTVAAPPPVRPQDLTAPQISGTAKAGSTLTCSPGTWSGSPTSFAYLWLRDGTPLSGATGATYVVQTLDEGTTLTCAVTASNSAGSAGPATSAGVPVPVPFVARCPAASGRLSGKTLGPIHLGMSRKQAQHAYRHSSDRGKRYEDFFCLTPIGVRIGLASPALPRRLRGTVVWASTSNPYFAVDGVRPGATLAAAQAKLRHGNLFHIGANQWYLARAGSATAVLKVRHGIVEEIGIAERSLTRSRSAQRRLMHSFY